MGANEHIVLESDTREVPNLRAARKIHARVCLKSRLRRHILELHLIDYYYLGVRTQRARAGVLEYVLDLRFIAPSLRLNRHIAWRWMLAALALALLFVTSVWYISSSPGSWWRHDGLPASATLFGLTACAAFVCIYRTTETVSVQSVHGRAKLLEFTAGLGLFRKFRPFRAKLAAHLKIAIGARRQSRAEHLRDEMREHFRLRETGVLSEKDYEASKMHILGAHGRAAAS